MVYQNLIVLIAPGLNLKRGVVSVYLFAQFFLRLQNTFDGHGMPGSFATKPLQYCHSSIIKMGTPDDRVQTCHEKIMLSDVFNNLQNTFKTYTDIQFSFSDPDIQIVIDENYLFTILQNLTANSVQALNGFPSPEIRYRTWKEIGEVFISITDNGPGLTGMQAAAMLTNKTIKNEKTGFGFFIVRDLAKAILLSR
jgi:light-regulated signal transduction histidine kinase (bacteriophytochrome)